MPYGALSGGTFTTQNKSIPGTYINVVSAQKVNEIMSERGIACFPVELDWGDSRIVRMKREDFESNALKMFGYESNAIELKSIREIFKNSTEAVIGRINGGEKASAKINNFVMTAQHSGVAGNRIRVIIQSNIDEPEKYNVITYIDNVEIDNQFVTDANELQDNHFISFSGSGITASAGIVLEGGTNSTPTGEDYVKFLEIIERESYHTLGYFGTDKLIKELFVNYTKRMRDTVGVKFQTVLHDYSADHEGIISVKNTAALVPWVLGVEAGISLSKDATNKIYDGELEEIPVLFDFEKEKANGHLLMYRDGSEYRMLDDINTLTTDAEDKLREDFSDNKVIRTLDQIAIDTAVIFNTKHLGKTPNTISGRGFFKEDIVSHRRNLEDLQIIEDFNPDEVKVEIGVNRRSVMLTEIIKVINMMKYLYVTVEVI